ncbi:hypothetical protein AKJ09_02700 [Labilithrix luteola]|uniref:Uncharacterized protein n=1 Tax=Labilithrix luteola TaxID=1391654 RepID=A0A0K1PRN0_9BACT|nr:hypothetical protein AKJ09_02700 [Labilithrix luteola]
MRFLALVLALRTSPHSHNDPRVTARLSRRKPAERPIA